MGSLELDLQHLLAQPVGEPTASLPGGAERRSVGVFPSHIPAAHHQICFIGLEGLQHFRQQTFIVLEVAIHDGDKGGRAGQNTFNHSARQPASSHAMQALDPGIFRSNGLDLGGGAVRGIVIDENDLPAFPRENGFDLADQLGDIGPLIEGWHHNCDLQPFGRGCCFGLSGLGQGGIS